MMYVLPYLVYNLYSKIKYIVLHRVPYNLLRVKQLAFFFVT